MNRDIDISDWNRRESEKHVYIKDLSDQIELKKKMKLEAKRLEKEEEERLEAKL